MSPRRKLMLIFMRRWRTNDDLTCLFKEFGLSTFSLRLSMEECTRSQQQRIGTSTTTNCGRLSGRRSSLMQVRLFRKCKKHHNFGSSVPSLAEKRKTPTSIQIATRKRILASFQPTHELADVQVPVQIDTLTSFYV